MATDTPIKVQVGGGAAAGNMSEAPMSPWAGRAKRKGSTSVVRTIDHQFGLDYKIYQDFMSLEMDDNSTLAEYIWLGGKNELRSKTRSITKPFKTPEDLPIWNYDGSSTGQATTEESEVYIKPVKIVKDPFRRGRHVLVFCECLTPDLKPLPKFNQRTDAKAIFDQKLAAEPWFGIEQEYTLFEPNGRSPLGFPNDGMPPAQGQYYCSVGTGNAFGRMVADCHYRACMYAGLTISGTNAEVMPGQWEYQVGPCVGIDGADQLWVSRYIMERVCETFGVRVSWWPKPMQGDWNGAGCHTNFSTAAMRDQVEGEKAPYELITQTCDRLGKRHDDLIKVYGIGNEFRLTGAHETADIKTFSYDVANRGCSIRIPRSTHADKKGYLEDRRPASNMDPYIVTSRLFATSEDLPWPEDAQAS